MVALWVVLGLIVATGAVSVLGASFSIIGLSALFSGAAVAVAAMSASLEFAKFVLAAYLHQRWKNLNFLLKTYLTAAVVVLSVITSMGIFGFLSNAYQSASTVLEAENIKLNSLKNQQLHNSSEIERMNKAIDEIPASRVSRRLKARAEAEPAILQLTKQSENLEQEITQSNLKVLQVKEKVGPLIYIARAFQMDLDNVVKYLILIFVLVFDPLAICLVIATSDSLEARKRAKNQPQTAVTAIVNDATSSPQTAGDVATPAEEVISMRFADDKDRNAG